MICESLPALLGFSCMPLDEAGGIALVETPFRHADGDAVSMFIESTGDHVRFFDDGDIALHFQGRGVPMSGRSLRFIRSAAEKNGLTFTDEWCVETLAARQEAPQAFARFAAMLLDIASWEREHETVDVDVSVFLEEVAAALRRLYFEEPARNVEMVGLSRQQYQVDFVIGTEAVLALRPHHASVNGAIRKILDIRNNPDHAALRYTVVVDDRVSPDEAKRDLTVLGTVADEVKPMSALVGMPSADPMH